METSKNFTTAENENNSMASKAARFVVRHSRFFIAMALVFAMLGIHEIGVSHFGVVDNGTYGYAPLAFGFLLGTYFSKKH